MSRKQVLRWRNQADGDWWVKVFMEKIPKEYFLVCLIDPDGDVIYHKEFDDCGDALEYAVMLAEDAPTIEQYQNSVRKNKSQ